MAPKRSSDGAQQSGADKKRQKMRDQRTIPVAGQQQQQGRTGGSAGRGSNGLPPTIDVDKFAQARTFEISAMQRAMKTAKEAGTQRAFQSLPRHLRRRAASHNIRRLPTRLRARARFEVPKDAAKPKKTTRKMRGNKRKLKGSEKRDMLLRRQRNQIWLETHIWHAKRMRMTKIWGHRLAEKPTEKAFRSSYRASIHGALVHDASYFQYIELSGTLAQLEALLAEVCDKTAPSPASKRYSAGTREYTTNLYEMGAFPRGLVGPATYIWDVPSSIALTGEEEDEDETVRRLLVRLHPTIGKEALAVLRVAAAVTVQRPLDFAGVRPLERELLTFEITGRRATEVVKAVLKPVLKTGDETKEAWRKLSSAAGPGSVPSGMVIGLEVYDPRLSFPPKLDKSAPRIDGTDLLAPSPAIAEVTPFWDQKAREALRKPQFTKSEIDARRSKSLVPGLPLPALEQDDRIPLLLTQRTLTPFTSSSTAPPPPPMHSWTLTLPAGWGMPFFHSLVFSASRIEGLRERFQQSYESGAASWPADFPGTIAFEEWECRRESVEKGYWDRRPPAKRCNWAKVGEGTVWPWRAEMGEIVRSRWGGEGVGGAEGQTTPSVWIVPARVAQRIEVLVVGEGGGKRKSTSFVNEVAEQLASSLVADWRLRSAEGFAEALPELAAEASGSLLRDAIVRVRIRPCGRGTPQTLGMLYMMDEERLEAVRGRLGQMRGKGKARELATGEGEGAEDLCNPPKREDVVGRITTGGFSLARGEGYAVGFVPLQTYLDLLVRDLRDSSPTEQQKLVLFRNRDGEVYRAATLELLM